MIKLTSRIMSVVEETGATLRTVATQNGALGVIAVVLIGFLVVVVYRQHEDQIQADKDDAAATAANTLILTDIKTELVKLNDRLGGYPDISRALSVGPPPSYTP